MKRIVIIGNGIAGITAARHIRKRSDDEITVISAESDHFFSRTALMYIYMGHMAFENTKPYEDFFWEKNRIQLMREWVSRVDTENKRLFFAGGRHLEYDVLIIASGSKSNKFGWPGQDLAGVQGLYSLQDLELMETHTRKVERAVIVGGGLIGIEMAEMLLSRQIPVTFLVREASWMDFAFPAEESAMIDRHVVSHGIDLRLSTELDRIEADERGRVRAAVTKDGEEIPCQFLGLTVGVSPNVDFLQDSGIECQRGVMADDMLLTSAPDVYAAGDCVQLRSPKPGRRPIEPLWYTGRMMGETIARTVCGEPTTYDPGIWFNSAKFIDIEYQVYGDIKAKLGEGEKSLYWEHSSGEKSLRIHYMEADQRVIGFNLMGIRYRHELCHQWLEEGRTLPFILENLGAANFDPEFYAQYERELIQLYNDQHPNLPLRLKRRRGLKQFLSLRRASA
ncbi:MAG: FAD-dependent oxidoreductase [Deltaproteobacteria bacterium]|nr:FAD-dependent oxidoreductase [Deltaproteobacteria bacterium]